MVGHSFVGIFLFLHASQFSLLDIFRETDLFGGSPLLGLSPNLLHLCSIPEPALELGKLIGLRYAKGEHVNGTAL